jgi:hypothetical protein
MTLNNKFDQLNKSILLEAIDGYDYYTPLQRAVLHIIVQTSISGESKITTSYISEKVNISRTAVYKTFKKFISEGDITFGNTSKQRQRVILLNYNSMEKIISLHNLKK